MATAKDKEQETPMFSKEQLLQSKLFTPLHKDVLSALLEDGQAYTTDQVKQKIDAFLKEATK